MLANDVGEGGWFQILSQLRYHAGDLKSSSALLCLDVSLQIQERCSHRKGRKSYVKAGMRNAQWVRQPPQRKCKVRY